jgi:hypothetical protein
MNLTNRARQATAILALALLSVGAGSLHFHPRRSWRKSGSASPRVRGPDPFRQVRIRIER